MCGEVKISLNSPRRRRPCRAAARGNDRARSVDGLGLRREALVRRVGGDTHAVTRRVPFRKPAVWRVRRHDLALVLLLLLLDLLDWRAGGGVGCTRTHGWRSRRLASNLERWSSSPIKEGGLQAWEKRVLVSQWAGDAWVKLCDTYDFENCPGRVPSTTRSRTCRTASPTHRPPTARPKRANPNPNSDDLQL